MKKDDSKKVTQEKELRQLQEQREREKMEILAKADEIKNQTFEFDIDGELSLKKEIEDLPLDPIDNPEEKYQLYYKVIRPLFSKHLPKGEDFKEMRGIIYEEANTFLTGGHRKDKGGIRGADSRQSYRNDMNELVNILTEWVATKGSPFELYVKLRDINIEKGYGTSN
jgi:hypothetical protein